MINIPDKRQIIRVWIKIINPIDKGWFKNNIIVENIIIIIEKNVFNISKNSL